MLTRRGVLRGLAQIAVLGPLALKRLPKVLEENPYDVFVEAVALEFDRLYFIPAGDFYDAVLRQHYETEAQEWGDSGLAQLVPTPGATG